VVYEVKAAFLYKFARFAEWPPAAFDRADSPLAICIFGPDPFSGALERTVAGESVNGRPITILRPGRSQELRKCHLVFFSQPDRSRLVEQLQGLMHFPVVTVGETADFLEKGGVIRLVVEQNRVHVEVNLQALDRNPVKLSSKLLRIARLVRWGP
jgi:hypothetical protein